MFKSDHSRLRFPSKSAQSWKTLKNGCFWHCIVIIEWSRFFPGKPPCTFLVLIVVNIHAKKLRNPRCGSPGILLTDRQTDTRTNKWRPDLNWSWELKRPDGHAQLQSLNVWIDCLTSWTSSTSRTSRTSQTSRLKETLFLIFNVRFSESLTCRDFLASF